MSAADYYGTNGGGYPPPPPPNQSSSPYPSQPQYAQPTYAGSGASSPYPAQPTYARQGHGQAQEYLAPQPQHASRPGSAHSNAGSYAPPPYSSANALDRSHSADPYAARDEKHTQEQGVGEDGERGLGATLLGGGAGGFLGHKLGKGKLGTMLGSAVVRIRASRVIRDMRVTMRVITEAMMGMRTDMLLDIMDRIMDRIMGATMGATIGAGMGRIMMEDTMGMGTTGIIRIMAMDEIGRALSYDGVFGTALNNAAHFSSRPWE
ncbi:hypothetical protein AAE478_001381 [Parahypoxylon ruwenzoriense]